MDLPLAEVDQVGVEEDADSHEDDQEPELLVGLLQGVEQGLEAGEVTDELEHPVRQSELLSLMEGLPNLS